MNREQGLSKLGDCIQMSMNAFIASINYDLENLPICQIRYNDEQCVGEANNTRYSRETATSMPGPNPSDEGIIQL